MRQADAPTLCARHVKSAQAIRSVCISEAGTEKEILYINTDRAAQAFKASETNALNAGINPAYHAELSTYFLVSPKTYVPVFAEATKNYKSGELETISGKVGDRLSFIASHFETVH